MVSNQLTDYIKDQFGHGATKEDLRSALIKAGWPEEDVNDSLKSVFAAHTDAQTAKDAVPNVISVNDFSLGSDLEVVPIVTGNEAAPKKAANENTQIGKISAEKKSKPHSSVFAVVVFAVIAVLGAGLAGFFYWQKIGSDKQMAALTAAADSVNGKISDLNGQIANLEKAQAESQAKRDELQAKVSNLMSINNELAEQLLFFMIPAGTSSSAEIAVNATGTLYGGKAPYFITLSNGISVSVKNSKDVKVDAALKALLGKNVQIEGTHLVGSRDVIVTKVNGEAVR